MMQRSRQSGIAIITAVAVAALVAALAGFMAFRHSLWLRQVENQHDLAQARNVARAAIDLCRLNLQDDGRQNKLDHAQEVWAVPIPNIPVERGQAGGRISDASGKFNLNNLVDGSGNVSSSDLDAYKRILTELGLPATDLSNGLLDWLDNEPSSVTRTPGGAEDREYLTENPPRRAANRTLFDLDELRQVHGYTAAVVKRLEPYVVVLPTQAAAVNVNFASATILAAVLDIDPGTAQTLVTKRDAEPFTDTDLATEIATITANFPSKTTAQTALSSKRIDVVSQFFVANVDARFGRVTVSYRALLDRTDPSHTPLLVWLRRR